MSVERGSSFLLKLGSENELERFTPVAGMTATKLAIAGEAVPVTNGASGGWRVLLDGAGVRSASVQATGIFLGSAAEIRMRTLALQGRIAPYLLTFESGEQMSGRFLVIKLEYAGDYDGERTYHMTLESSGAVVST